MRDDSELTDEVIEQMRRDVMRSLNKRFLGTWRAPNGTTHVINEDTPVGVLLDVIEALHSDIKRREHERHQDNLSILRAIRGLVS